MEREVKLQYPQFDAVKKRPCIYFKVANCTNCTNCVSKEIKGSYNIYKDESTNFLVFIIFYIDIYSYLNNLCKVCNLTVSYIKNGVFTLFNFAHIAVY